MENAEINYSEELKRFIMTVSKETAEDKADGILGKLLQITGGEREVYEFVVGEGYNITYVEFLEYYKACQLGVSAASAELSDDDLDKVAGGWGIHISSIANRAGNAVSSAAHNATEYVADNPGAFIAGSGAIAGGIGTAAGAATGAIIGGIAGSAAAGVGAVPGATLGGAVGGAVGGGAGTAVGGVIGMGTVIIANEIVH